MSRALPPDVVRACVVSGGVTTHYEVAGRGDPVVILTSDRARLETLLTGGPRDQRVIAPDLSAGSEGSRAAEADFPAWLGAFLEALGLARVTLVADVALAQHVARFAGLDPDRLARVELLPTASED